MKETGTLINVNFAYYSNSNAFFKTKACIVLCILFSSQCQYNVFDFPDKCTESSKSSRKINSTIEPTKLEY